MKKSCRKKKKKNNFKKIFKGFTLVELLAVIVILAIIMLIAIPAVLETMETARRKSFIEYVDKVSTLSQKQMAEDQMIGTKSLTECTVYNVKTGLDLNNTGDYEGWVLIKPSNNDIYVTLFDDNYVIIGYHYSDSSLKMDDYIQKKTNENASELTVEELCKSSSCTSCNVDGTNIEGKKDEKILYLVSKTQLHIGDIVPDGLNFRNTPEEAMADWQNVLNDPGATRPYYLKHKIVNNKISESYVEFIVTPEMAATYSGMTAGTYTFRGAFGNETDLSEKPNFEANKAESLKAWGSSYCKDYTEHFNCSYAKIAKLYTGVGTTGGAIAGETTGHYCRVLNDFSECS